MTKKKKGISKKEIEHIHKHIEFWEYIHEEELNALMRIKQRRAIGIG